MTILIPSYEPDERLIKLIDNLQSKSSAQIVIVNDGSGREYDYLFNQAREKNCTVLDYPSNEGKGYALKTGFTYIKDQTNESQGIVTADSDGQHLVKDILHVADEVTRNKDRIVLGTRAFSGNVPFRSRFGNEMTRKVFHLVTGTDVSDTQTGLRGFSPSMLKWLLKVPGDRFEYEMTMLLEANRSGYSFIEVPIQTVYMDENESSHFRPVRDSIKVYAPFFKHVASCISEVFHTLTKRNIHSHL